MDLSEKIVEIDRKLYNAISKWEENPTQYRETRITNLTKEKNDLLKEQNKMHAMIDQFL